VQRIHPELRIEPRSVNEAEYSRADTTRLSSAVEELRFADIMDFIEEAFSVGAQGL